MSCLHNWNMKCLKKGDTFKEKVFWVSRDITDYEFLFQFRKSSIGPNTNEVAFQWSSADNTIVRSESDDKVVDGTNYYALRLSKKDIDVEPSNYVSDFQAVLPNGDVETLFDANILIVEDYSRS